MKYMLLAHVQESGWTALTPAQQEQGMAAYQAFTQALVDAGAMAGSGRLGASAAASTVRTIGGRVVMLDGPFAETKEQLGGYFIIDVADRAAALAWAARCPASSHGVVEVRPILET
jgi:hypothetical protein